MIYQCIVEGEFGSSYQPRYDSLHVFFSAPTAQAARDKRDKLIQELVGLNDRYETYNCFDEVELKMSALEPEAFENAYLVETGVHADRMSYIKEAIIFLVGDDRQKVMKALEMGRQTNAQHALRDSSWANA